VRLVARYRVLELSSPPFGTRRAALRRRIVRARRQIATNPD
jgi:hypothetical protein